MSYRWQHQAAATAAVANQFVTSTAMKNSTYTVANSGAMPTAGARLITVTHAIVATGTDTLGTVTVVGTNLGGDPISEAITPLAGTVASGVQWFASVTSVTGAGWIIAGGNDTIQVGCGARVIVAEGSGIVHSVIVNTTASGAVSLKDASGTIAVLKSAIAEGTYYYDVDFSGFLEVVLAAASDITVTYRLS